MLEKVWRKGNPPTLWVGMQMVQHCGDNMGVVAAGAHGLMIEVHNDPAHALCDGPQSLTPEAFADVTRAVRSIYAAMEEI